MDWFKKKKDEDMLPDLPSDNELPRLPNIGDNPVVPELPSLNGLSNQYTPDHDEDSGYPPLLKPNSSGQNEIKQIISSNEVKKSPYGISTNEELVEGPIIAEPSNLIEEPPEQESIEKPRSNILSSDKEEIYIRLDKFKFTKQSIDVIREKIDDMSKTLGKIKEVKEREQKELEEWENEIMIMKTKIDTIDSKLFDKME